MIDADSRHEGRRAALLDAAIAAIAEHGYDAVRLRNEADEVRRLPALLEQMLAESVAAGVEHGAVLPVDDATGILIAAVDGFELALTARAGIAQPDQSRRRVMRLAGVLFPPVDPTTQQQ